MSLFKLLSFSNFNMIKDHRSSDSSESESDIDEYRGLSYNCDIQVRQNTWGYIFPKFTISQKTAHGGGFSIDIEGDEGEVRENDETEGSQEGIEILSR
jgi:hypothetical protein